MSKVCPLGFLTKGRMKPTTKLITHFLIIIPFCSNHSTLWLCVVMYLYLHAFLTPFVVYCLLNLCLATRVRSFQAANPSFFLLFFVVGCAHIANCYVSRTEPRMLLLQRHCIHSSSTLVRSNEGVFAIKCSHLFPSYLGGNESLWPIKPFDSSKICLQFCIKHPPVLHAWYDRNYLLAFCIE